MTIQDELKMTRQPDPGQELILSLLLTREVLAEVTEARVFAPFGITDQQFNVLRILKGGPPEGYTLADLRRRLLHRNADAVRLVERMIPQGWVARTPHPGDRRATLVRLTEAGRDLLDRLADPHEAYCQEIAALMPGSDREHLVKGLDALRMGLRRMLEPGVDAP